METKIELPYASRYHRLHNNFSGVYYNAAHWDLSPLEPQGSQVLFMAGSQIRALPFTNNVHADLDIEAQT